MINEKQKTFLKENKTLIKKQVIDEAKLINNLISYFIVNNKKGTGSIILARQFQPITKSELFYHAAFFNQFINNIEKGQSEQRSFMDNQENRFLFFPLENSNENENLYSVLLMKKDYNIFSALSIIKLIQRMIFEIIKNNKNENSKGIDNDKGKVRINNFLFILICYRIII